MPASADCWMHLQDDSLLTKVRKASQVDHAKRLWNRRQLSPHLKISIQSNSIIVEKMVAPKFSTILEFSTIMDFCVVQGNELSRVDRVYCINCKFLFTAIAAE